jgi:ASPIC/UnbV protein
LITTAPVNHRAEHGLILERHDPLELHFGLGDADRVDDIVVRWPSGIVQRLGGQRARQRITITESGR